MSGISNTTELRPCKFFLIQSSQNLIFDSTITSKTDDFMLMILRQSSMNTVHLKEVSIQQIIPKHYFLWKNDTIRNEVRVLNLYNTIRKLGREYRLTNNHENMTGKYGVKLSSHFYPLSSPISMTELWTSNQKLINILHIIGNLQQMRRWFRHSHALSSNHKIKTPSIYLILLTGTRRVRLTQRYNGMRVFGVSTSVELDEVGQPTGSSLGHVINGIHYDVSYIC